MFPNNAKNQYHYSVLWSVYCKYNSQYVNKKTYEKRYCISKVPVIVTDETDMAVIYIAMTHVSRGQTMFNKMLTLIKLKLIQFWRQILKDLSKEEYTW